MDRWGAVGVQHPRPPGCPRSPNGCYYLKKCVAWKPLKASCCDFLKEKVTGLPARCTTGTTAETASHHASFFAFCFILIFILCPHPTATIFSNGSLGSARRPPRPIISSTVEGRGSLEWSMSGCHYPSPTPPEQDRRYQHKVSLVVRYFMIPCNICLILLATSTLGFAVLLFLNNCT